MKRPFATVVAIIGLATIALVPSCAQPTATAAPSTPTCLTAKASAASNSVALDWDDAVWAAGSTNRRYEVHEDLFGGVDNLAATVTVSNRTSGSLAAGTYRYYVLAKDSTGTAVMSPKVTVTVPVSGTVASPAGCDPNAPPTTTTTTVPPAVPSAPTCLVATAGAASNSVALDWDDVVWASGSTNRRYEVHEDLFGGVDNLTATVTVSNRTSGSLAAGTYRYYVLAKDSVGTSAVSPKVTVTVPVSGTVASPAGCNGTTTTTTTTTTTPPTTTTTTPTTTTTTVPPSGCDRNATPSTFAAEVTAATAGQTVCLANGNYGTWAGTNKAITVKSASGQGAVMTASFGSGDAAFTLASVTLNGSNRITNGANHITIRDSAFTTPIILSVANGDITLDHNTHINISGTLGDERVGVDNVNGLPSGVTIKNSLFKGLGSDGIQDTAAGTVITDNEFLDICEDSSGNHTDNIQLVFDGARDVVIQRNWFHDTAACTTQVLTAFDSVIRATITDNVSDIDSRPWGIEWFSDDTSVIDHNTLTGRDRSTAGVCDFGKVCGEMWITSKTANDPGFGTIITNNIVSQIQLERATLGRRDHNMMVSPGPNDFSGVPAFVGGTNPTSRLGYCLAPGSPGKGRASDGLDVGIRC